MNKKKFIFILLVVALLIPATVLSAGIRENISAIINKDIKITWNGQPYTPVDDVTNEPMYPIVYKDRTYLPVRYVAEKAGVDVGWDGNTSTVILNREVEATVPPTSTEQQGWIKVESDDLLGLYDTLNTRRYLDQMKRAADYLFVVYKETSLLAYSDNLKAIDSEDISQWYSLIDQFHYPYSEKQALKNIGWEIITSKNNILVNDIEKAGSQLLKVSNDIEYYNKKYIDQAEDHINTFFDAYVDSYK